MLPWKRESGKRCCTRSDMVPTQQKNIQTVHEGHKTHDSQMTDHTAWTKHDMTACCRNLSNSSSSTPEKRATVLPLQPVLSYTQHSATPLWQGSRNNCPCSSPTEPLCPTLTKVSLCLAPQLLQPRAASHSNRPSWASCSLGGLVLFHHTCKGMQSRKHTPCPPPSHWRNALPRHWPFSVTQSSPAWETALQHTAS